MVPWVSKILPHASRLQSLHNLLVRTRPHLKSFHEAKLHAHETLDETHIYYYLIKGCFSVVGTEGVFVCGCRDDRKWRRTAGGRCRGGIWRSK